MDENDAREHTGNLVDWISISPRYLYPPAQQP